MRAAELVLLGLVVLAAVRPVTRWSRSMTVAAALTVAQLLTVLVHVFVDGVRWQLVPLYVAAGVTIAVGALGSVRSCPPSSRRLGWFVVVGLVCMGALAGWALPIVQLPAPGGPAPVGTVSVALRDDHRAEVYGDEPGGPREVVAQVWYPAGDTSGARPSPWVRDGRRFGREAAGGLGLPPFALDHLALVRSNAVADAPMSDAASTFPLVVYAHGWTGFGAIQSDLAEDLASAGYVVVALDHTYGAVATVFPDGRVVPQDPEALPSDAPEEVYDEAARQLVATFAADLRFLLDELAAGAVPVVADRLMLDAVALIGHSTGGGAAIAACAEERRCGAVVGFDPWVEPVSDDTIGSGLEVPLLSLRSEEWVDNANDSRLRRLHAASNGPSGLVALAGVAHRDFTLLPFLSPLSGPLGLTGDTAGTRTHEIVGSWTRAFLDTHLRGIGVDPLDRPPDLAEATIDG